MKLSVVTMMYCSAPFLAEFYRRMSQSVQLLTDSYELIFVNDGSPDESLSMALNFAQQDPKVRVVDLSRNFGHHQAALAGLATTIGEHIFIIDCDLEEQPEWLEEFSKVLSSHEDADVVFGVQGRRQQSFFRRVSSILFYRVFNILSETKIPASACTVRIMSRRYVESLLLLQEKKLFLAGNYAWIGYKQVAITVNKKARQGRSTYNLFRLLDLSMRAITSFSAYPLKLIFIIGSLTATLAIGGAAVLLVYKLLFPHTTLLGWASLILSLWFLGGVIIACIGVVGIYLSSVFVEVKNRPSYIVRSTYPSSNRAPENE